MNQSRKKDNAARLKDDADQNLDVSNAEDADKQQKQRPRRNVTQKTYSENSTFDILMDELGDDDDDDENLNDDEDIIRKTSRRNVKRIKLDKDESSTSDIQARSAIEVTRKSNRSTQFRKSLAEPTTSMLECVVESDPTDDGNEESEKKNGKSKNQNDGNNSRSGARKQQLQRPLSPRKSPAKRHVERRQSLHLHDNSKNNHGASNSDDSDFFESQHDDDDDEGEESDEDDIDEEPLKIQRIIASRTETISKWQEICRTMNTSEVHYGSRWYQQQQGSSDKLSSNDKKGEDTTYEERFLVKWADLSYLHVSWETEHDLIDQVDGQPYLRTFFRKSTHGLLYSADERCDGAYYDPAYNDIDRILEVQLPDDSSNVTLTIENEKTFDSTSFGVIIDKEDPNFDSGTGRQFLIKWCNMSYTESTYEFERDLIMNEIEYKTKTIEYLRRTTKPTKSIRQQLLKTGEEEFKRLYSIFGKKSKLSDVNREKGVEQYKQSLQQTIYKNGGQLRDYQAEGVAWMMANIVNRRGSILADEMGLGKTLQTAAVVNLVTNTFHWDSPVLIVAPLSTLTHWYREFVRWTDLNVIVYHGAAADRRLIRENEFAYPDCRPQTDTGINQLYLKKCGKRSGSGATENPWMIDVVITSPEVMTADDANELTAVQWELLVVDEAHRLKNHKSKLSIGLRGNKFTFRHRILLTGTPIQNDVQEFWSLLNFIDPDGFDSLDDFMSKYGDMKDKESVDALHEEIRLYILRRLKEDVEKSVPPKEETLIEVELTVAQKQYYRALYEKNVKFLHKNNKKPMDGPSLNNLAMQLRKCCNHLFLLNGVESEFRRTHGAGVAEGDFLVMGSGKLILLDKLLPRLKEEGHRVILFSQFKIMLDIVEDYLRAREMQFERIDGSITGNKRQQAIDRFQAESTDKREAPFIMLLSTRAGGVGITLTAADTCIIFDSDWNPQNDLQAQARCHRIGQTKSVKVYRLLTRKTYEMQMFHMSSLKMGLDQVVLKGFESNSSGEGALTKAEVEKLLRHGAYDIFNEEKAGQAEAESNAFVQQDIDSILQRRSHTILHDHTGSQSNAAGGTFSKASFKAKSHELNSKGEDIDIEDPDFWKKMIGEGNVVADEQNLDRRRPRAQLNYSENIDVDENVIDDVDSVESAEYIDEQKVTLGGSNPWEWRRDDIEAIIMLLATYGYGRLPWSDFLKRANLSKSYDLTEVQRMCWTLVLFSLIETVDENAELAVRRDERQFEKTREVELSKRADGGILASNAFKSGLGLDLELRKEKEFKKLWHETINWNNKVISDAVLFATSNTPRSTIGLYQRKSSQSVQSFHGADVQAQFNSLVWPSLKLRGWTSLVTANAKTIYTFHQNEYHNIETVLGASASLHPEIANVASSILERIESLRKETERTALHEKSQDLALSQTSASYEGIKDFLCKYGPIQLINDRLKAARRIRLPRTVFSVGSILHVADTLVRHASVRAGSMKLSVDELAELIESNCKAVPPHPMWTSRHDAVLIHAVAKHGWINEDLAVRAVAADNLIDWGLPFGLSTGHSNSSADSQQIMVCAGRVVEFFSKQSKMLNEIKSFNKQRIINAYGLRRLVNGDGHDMWHVEGYGSGLSENSKPIDLPPKKDLVKRAKTILSKMTVIPDGVSERKLPSHNYTELDLKDGSNIFLAEILRAAVKESTISANIKFLFKVAAEEARHHAASLPVQENREPTSAAMALIRIAEHIDHARFHLAKRATQSKNVLRAILGEEPVVPRNSEEGLFPPEKTILPKLRKSYDGILSSTKSTDNSTGNRNRSFVTFGEKAIKLSRERLLNHYSDEISSNAKYQCLELTEIETIILSTACSLGIPVWNEDWEHKLLGETMMPMGHCLTWQAFGIYMVRIAEKSLQKVKEQLDHASALCKQEYAKSASNEERRSAESALEFANYNFKCKELVSTQAKEYTSEPETLAKKAIMLIEKLRRHMTAVIVSALTTRSDNGLGSKVLVWFRKELLKWATSLDILDDNGRPFAFTAVEFLDDLDESERTTIEVSSIFDKKCSRSVICQAAMLSRLRSIYCASSMKALLENISVVNNIFVTSRDFWSSQPTSWNGMCDVVLVQRLMGNGFGEALLCDYTSIHVQATFPSFYTYNLSNESIQIRANQLTRELHLLAEEQAASARHTFLPENTHAASIPRTASLKSDNNIIDLVAGDD